MNAAELADKSSVLFSLPDVYLRLLDKIKQPTTHIDEMAALISTDAALTARLLKLANSSFYAFPSQIDTITRAIKLIGTRQLMSLVLATSVADAFSSVPSDIIDMDRFWRHNVDTALVARALAIAARHPESEKLFVMGLLHNLGKLVVLTEQPGTAARILQPDPDELPWALEAQALGFTFAECGACLLANWQLPEALVAAVRYQHQPGDCAHYPVTSAILHIASRAASAMEQEERIEPGPDYLALIDAQAWQLAGIGADDLEAAMAFAEEEAWHMLGILSSATY